MNSQYPFDYIDVNISIRRQIVNLTWTVYKEDKYRLLLQEGCFEPVTGSSSASEIKNYNLQIYTNYNNR